MQRLLGDAERAQPPLELTGPGKAVSLDAVVEAWRCAVYDGSAPARGSPNWLNILSKVAQARAAARVVPAR